nr:MAG TPA: hypothetical protein [Caudoviricetes sp.]
MPICPLLFVSNAIKKCNINYKYSRLIWESGLKMTQISIDNHKCSCYN